MKFWATVCKVFGYVWLTLAGILILIGIVGVWMKEGFSGVQELLSPFNIANWLVTIVTLAPGVGLLMLSERLEQRARQDRERQSSSGMPYTKAVEIAGDYGALLEHGAPVPGTVADITKLPYPKSEIREALIVILQATSDRYMREQLKIAYISLAGWQEGVGCSNIGLDLVNMELSQDPKALVEQVLARGKDYEKWAPIVEAERKRLQSELEELGLW